jgi:hypothetical protein
MGRLILLLVLAVAAAIFVPLGSATSASDFTCSGGSIPSGTYNTLTVTGACSVDSGNVTVLQGATVNAGADLYAAYGGSDLVVDGSLNVLKSAVLILGCEPQQFICFNDPDQSNGTLSTNDRVGNFLYANLPLAVIVHHSTLGSVWNHGGVAGVNCNPQAALFGSPAYFTYEDNTITGGVEIGGWHACWAGFIRNTVGDAVSYNGSTTASPDGNEIASNTIGEWLNCTGDSPKPQIGDSGGSLNTVGLYGGGQCFDIVKGPKGQPG